VGVAVGSRTSAIAASTAARYASRVAASFAQIASALARDLRYAAEASAAETSASARASASRASRASAPAPTRTVTVFTVCASMVRSSCSLCSVFCSGHGVTGVVVCFGSLSIRVSQSIAFAGSSTGSASSPSSPGTRRSSSDAFPDEKKKHPSASPPGSSAATLMVSLSNPLARATPREKRAEPASRSTHSTVFLFCVVFGNSRSVSENSAETSSSPRKKRAFVSFASKENERKLAASTLILGPSERSSRAPRSAPALRVTSTIPLASRLAVSESFQRATPSRPHTACAPHEHASDSESEAEPFRKRSETETTP
jgi:hypothetical protein